MTPKLIRAAVCPTVGKSTEPTDLGSLDAAGRAHGVRWPSSRRSCGSGPHGPIRNRGLPDGGLDRDVSWRSCCDLLRYVLPGLQDKVNRFFEFRLRIAPCGVRNRQRLTLQQVRLCHIAQRTGQIGPRLVQRMPERHSAGEIQYFAQADAFFPFVSRFVDQHSYAQMAEKWPGTHPEGAGQNLYRTPTCFNPQPDLAELSV